MKQKKVKMIISVSQETKKILQQQSKEQGVAPGVLIELYIDSFIKKCEKEDL